MHIHINAHIYTWVVCAHGCGYLSRIEENVRVSGASDGGNCELPAMGAAN